MHNDPKLVTNNKFYQDEQNIVYHNDIFKSYDSVQAHCQGGGGGWGVGWEHRWQRALTKHFLPPRKFENKHLPFLWYSLTYLTHVQIILSP